MTRNIILISIISDKYLEGESDVYHRQWLYVPPIRYYIEVIKDVQVRRISSGTIGYINLNNNQNKRSVARKAPTRTLPSICQQSIRPKFIYSLRFDL